MQIDEPDPSHALADACLGAMTTRRRSTSFANSSAPGDARRGQDTTRSDEGIAGKCGVDGRVGRERARMVEARQSELDRVSDRHDSYVRSSFFRCVSGLLCILYTQLVPSLRTPFFLTSLATQLLLSSHGTVLIQSRFCRYAKPFSSNASRHYYSMILRCVH